MKLKEYIYILTLILDWGQGIRNNLEKEKKIEKESHLSLYFIKLKTHLTYTQLTLQESYESYTLVTK